MWTVSSTTLIEFTQISEIEADSEVPWLLSLDEHIFTPELNFS